MSIHESVVKDTSAYHVVKHFPIDKKSLRWTIFYLVNALLHLNHKYFFAFIILNNCTFHGVVPADVVTRLPVNWTQWAGAVIGSVLVGLSGVLPLILVPASKSGANTVSEDNLKYLLGFAVGGLLGDVFLHLLPETYQHVSSQ